jgi:hypothetical protein
MKNNPFKKQDKFNNNTNNNTNKSSFKDPNSKNFKYDPNNNSFNKSNSQKKLDTNNSINKTSIDLNNGNVFPDLVLIKKNTQPNIEECKFKNILTNIMLVNHEPPKIHLIPHGCLEITRILNKYVYEYGETTNFIKKEEDINYIMNNLIETMKQKWDKYENDYDNIYGEGVYANKFRLPPDDLTSEEQNNSDEYDSDDYDSNEYYSNE